MDFKLKLFTKVLLLKARIRFKLVFGLSIVSLIVLSLIIRSDNECKRMQTKAFTQMCASDDSQLFVGSLCHRLCSDRTLRLTDCPNLDGHDGKDYVFVAHLFDRNDRRTGEQIVLKARSLTTFELIGSDGWKEYFKDDNQLIKDSINQLMSAKFGQPVVNKTDYYIQQLMSESTISKKSLINLWLLIQDHEYLMSRMYPTLFPPIVGTCGHFYGVQYADPILDLSYFTPNRFPFQWKSRPLTDRISVGINIIEFLLDFESIDPKLELCDIKFEHLGYVGSKMALIDSDMIYPKKSAVESIESLNGCQQNSDCDFIDCKGVCLQNSCSFDETDDDLKRICRNLFFMGKLYGIFDFGLFSVQTSDVYLAKSFDSIRVICFQRTDLLSDTKLIRDILVDIDTRLTEE